MVKVEDERRQCVEQIGKWHVRVEDQQSALGKGFSEEIGPSSELGGLKRSSKGYSYVRFSSRIGHLST